MAPCSSSTCPRRLARGRSFKCPTSRQVGRASACPTPRRRGVGAPGFVSPDTFVFRVVAVNALGESLASLPSEPVTKIVEGWMRGLSFGSSSVASLLLACLPALCSERPRAPAADLDPQPQSHQRSHLPGSSLRRRLRTAVLYRVRCLPRHPASQHSGGLYGYRRRGALPGPRGLAPGCCNHDLV